MNDFIRKYNEKINGTLHCFDRIVFKGDLPIGFPDAMIRILNQNDTLKRFETWDRGLPACQ